MSIPTPYTLKVKSTTDGTPDDFGNPTTTESIRDWPVYFIAPGGMQEQGMGSRDLSVVVFTVGAPAVDVPTEYDQVLVDGQWFGVNGHPRDWTRGPFGFKPGVTVELRVANG